MQSPSIFQSADVNLICELFEGYRAEETYLTWRTPLLRQELYKRKVNESSQLLIDGLRHEFGVETPVNLELAVELYEKAYRLHFNAGAFCRRLVLLRKLTPEAVGNCDDIVYDLLRCMTRSNDLVISTLWLDLIRKGNSFKGRVLQLLQFRLNAAPTDPQAILLKQLYSVWSGKIDAEEFIKKTTDLVLVRKFVLAAQTILNMCLPSEEQLLTAETQEIGRACAALIRETNQHQYFGCVGKFLHAVGQIGDARQVFEEGLAHHYWECSKLLLCLDKLSSGEQPDYERLARMLDRFSDTIICYGHRSEFYDYIFLYNLVRRKSKETITPQQQATYREICSVAERFKAADEDSFIATDIESILACYFDERLPLQHRIDSIAEQTKSISSKSSKRIALYHLMKLHNKRLRAAQRNLEDTAELARQAKAAQELFIKYSTQTIKKSEFPTAIYRLAVCYEKGYGVDKNLGMSYLLYSKAVEQYARKLAQPNTLFHMSFLNVYSTTESKRRLSRIDRSEEVQALKSRICKQFEDEKECAICMATNSDTILFPCMHMFSEGCLAKLHQEVCPKCRSPIIVELSLQSCGIH